ncbi:MAG: hypothetical protein FWF77_04355 [Defluviitaleaceae bacterium]|nr:hypothetical protein [Defluviitaleaceae bacterium]
MKISNPTPPPTWLSELRASNGNGGLLPTGLSQEHLEWRTNKQNPVFRANQFLNGIPGREGFEEPLGVQAMTQILRENGIELPENARFNISVNRYGGVEITGLDNDTLAREIEQAMSYDARMILSVLAMFAESARVLDGNPSNTSNGLSIEQSRLIQIQSNLMDFGVGLQDLRLVDGRIQGLPQELHDKIYGDRTAWLAGMDPAQATWESQNIDRIRDSAIHFLQNGTSHIPAPNISLTFADGRIIVNSTGGFNATA